LTRIATRATSPAPRASASTRSSSPADSTLIAFRPNGTAQASSASDLPTPVKTMSAGVKPALRASSISQIELASAAAPRSRSSRASASVELALRA
jgi:hypothetical protein